MAEAPTQPSAPQGGQGETEVTLENIQQTVEDTLRERAQQIVQARMGEAGAEAAAPAAAPTFRPTEAAADLRREQMARKRAEAGEAQPEIPQREPERPAGAATPQAEQAPVPSGEAGPGSAGEPAQADQVPPEQIREPGAMGPQPAQTIPEPEATVTPPAMGEPEGADERTEQPTWERPARAPEEAPETVRPTESARVQPETVNPTGVASELERAEKERAHKQEYDQRRFAAKEKARDFGAPTLPPELATAGAGAPAVSGIQQDFQSMMQIYMQQDRALSIRDAGRTLVRRKMQFARKQANEQIQKQAEKLAKEAKKMVEDWIERAFGPGSVLEWEGAIAWFWSIVGYARTAMRAVVTIFQSNKNDKFITGVISWIVPSGFDMDALPTWAVDFIYLGAGAIILMAVFGIINLIFIIIGLAAIGGVAIGAALGGLTSFFIDFF